VGGRRSCRQVEVIKNYNDFEQCQALLLDSESDCSIVAAQRSDNMSNHIPG